jgi:hypothetical protein
LIWDDDPNWRVLRMREEPSRLQKAHEGAGSSSRAGALTNSWPHVLMVFSKSIFFDGADARRGDAQQAGQ